MKWRGVLAVLSAVVMVLPLTACDSGNGSRAGVETAETRQRNPNAKDDRVRPVRMASGDALSHLLGEPASQVLCQVIDKQAWERLLGGGVGRRPGVHSCSVASEFGGIVRMFMTSAGSGLHADTTVAGRPARRAGQGYVVSLTDGDGRAADTSRQHPLVEISVTAQNSQREELLERVVAEVVPLLTKPGEKVPRIGEDTKIEYVRTPLTRGGEIVDVPRPLQALQLCTLLKETAGLGLSPRAFEASNRAGCQVRQEGRRDNVGVLLDKIDPGEEGKFTAEVADRPAKTDERSTTVQLRDDALVALMVIGDRHRELAEKLVPLLLEK